MFPFVAVRTKSCHRSPLPLLVGRRHCVDVGFFCSGLGLILCSGLNSCLGSGFVLVSCLGLGSGLGLGLRLCPVSH